MPRSQDSIQRELYDQLKALDFNPQPMSSSGKEVAVPDSDDCDIIQFHFIVGDEDYGTVSLSIDGLRTLTLYYPDTVADSPKDAGDGVSWSRFIKWAKRFSTQRNLGFKLEDSDKLGSDMKRREHTRREEMFESADGDSVAARLKTLQAELATVNSQLSTNSTEPADRQASPAVASARERLTAQKRELETEISQLMQDEPTTTTPSVVAEGYYGTRQTSYNDAIPTVKMIIRHNRPLGESDARFRHVERIFVETSQGERLLLPTTSPSLGRVYARHIAEGGNLHDDRAQHIQHLAEESNQLRGFVRATRTQVFEGDAVRLVEAAQARYQEIRETVKSLSTRSGYRNYFESYEPSALIEDLDSGELATAFTRQSLDPRIESALPVLARLRKTISEQETTLAEADQFAEWAESVTRIEEELLPTSRGESDELADMLRKPLPVGADANNAKGAILNIIQDQQLYAKLDHLARHDPDADARGPIIDWLNRHINDPKFAEIIKSVDTDEEPVVKSGPDEKELPAPAQTAPAKPAPAQNNTEPADDDIDAQLNALAGLGESGKRNFVAKNAKKAGSGRHKSAKDYQRRPKHPQRVREESTEETLNLLMPEDRELAESESLLARIRLLSGL